MRMAETPSATFRPEHVRLRRRSGAALLAALLVLGTCAPFRDDAYAATYRWVEGDVVVKFRPGARSAVALEDLGVIQAEPLGSTGIDWLRLSGITTEQAVQRLKARPDVEYAEPNWLLEAEAAPNDSLFPQQWALRNTGQTGGTPGADIGAIAAWDLTTGSREVRVGVIDSGMDLSHPELAPNLFTNAGEIPGNLIDDDLNGYVDDVHGWNFVEGNGDPSDDYGHGTMAAGIIGAVGNDGRGVAGVCWQVSLIPIRIINAQGVGTLTAAIRAVDYATRMGVRLTNNSWGRVPPSPALSDVIRAAGDRGILFVCAAGNGGLDNDATPHYPSSFEHDNMVAVAATDALDELPRFSNYGATSVDLAAPGEAILSTFPGGGWYTLTGTSFSTPYVAGALALAFAREPNLSGPTARTLLLQTVKPLPSLAGRMVSGGRLDLARFIAAIDLIPPLAVHDLAATDVSGSRLTLTWTAVSDDDGTSPVSGYDVRRSLDPIDETNFDRTTPVPFGGSPAAPGQPERLEVTGLSFDATQYFALRTVDEHGNRSGISNVATARTPLPPRAAIVADPLDLVVAQGEAVERTLTIENLGPGELEFELDVQPVLDGHAIVGDSAAMPVAGWPLAGMRTPKPGRDPGRDRLRSDGALLNGWRVLVIAQTTDARTLDSALAAEPELSTVDVVRLDDRFPTLAELRGYDAVILVAATVFGSRTELGDLLADYADEGGGVVLTQGAFTALGLGGRLEASYTPFDPGPPDFDGATLATPHADHPLLQGVRGLIGHPVNAVSLKPGAEPIADWSNTRPCVATRRGVVGLNIAFGVAGGWGGDGVRLLVNAVRWSARRPTWLAFDVDRGVVPTGQTARVRITASALRIEPDRLARIVVRTNDPAALATTLPVRRTVLGAPRAELYGGTVRIEIAEPVLNNIPTPSLIAPTPSGAFGIAELNAVGRFANGNPGTRLYLEGTRVGSVGFVPIACGPLRDAFEIPQALLASALADGRLDLRIEPASSQANCPGSYSVAITYVTRADTVEFTPRYHAVPGSLPLLLRNTGVAPLRLDGVRSSHPDFEVTAASSLIPPGGTASLQVRYTAATVGTQQGVLDLGDQRSGSSRNHRRGAGRHVGRPMLTLNETEIHHRTFRGEADTVRLGVSNPGESAVTFEFVRGDFPGWLDVTPLAGTIAPGEQAVVALLLRTSQLQLGLHSAFLRVISNDPAAQDQRLAVVLEVAGRPHLTLGSAPVQRQSSLPYDPRGPCVTRHAFPLRPGPAGPVTVDVLALGDFSTQRYGLAIEIEGLALYQTPASNRQCAPLRHSFQPSPSVIAAAASDSILEITVSHESSYFQCAENRHDVSIRYSPVATAVDAGSVAIGALESARSSCTTPGKGR